jgi:hypothetical protein
VCCSIDRLLDILPLSLEAFWAAIAAAEDLHATECARLALAFGCWTFAFICMLIACAFASLYEVVCVLTVCQRLCWEGGHLHHSELSAAEPAALHWWILKTWLSV